MLKDKSSSAIVAVSGIARARRFYEDALGLDVVDDTMGEVLVFRTGDTSLIVYRSKEAGSNRANAVVWSVGDESTPSPRPSKPRASPSSTIPASASFKATSTSPAT